MVPRRNAKKGYHSGHFETVNLMGWDCGAERLQKGNIASPKGERRQTLHHPQQIVHHTILVSRNILTH
jgi:hypothetical protein